MTICGILENILSDIIIVLAVVFFSWLWILLTRRIPLQKFFGVSKTKRLIIYLSNINVLIFGSTGIDNKKYSYKGETVSYGEMQMANKLQELFSFIVPRLAETFKPIGKLFLSDIDVNIDISPRDENNLETQAPFISLGSPTYNVASLYIEKVSKESAKFNQESIRLAEVVRYEVPPSGSASSSDTNEYDPSSNLLISSAAGEFPYNGGTILPKAEIKPSATARAIQETLDEINGKNEPSIHIEGISPITDTLYGFVERINDPVSKRNLFYVASLSEHGTKSAAYFLATQWTSLYRKYRKNQPFIVMLRFDPLNFRKWTIVFERTLSC